MHVLCVSVYVYVCLLVCFHVSVCLSIIVGGVYVCVTVCLKSVFVCVCLCPCTVVGASLGLTLRGRGYWSMCTLQLPTWINGTQLSAPWQ